MIISPYRTKFTREHQEGKREPERDMKSRKPRGHRGRVPQLRKSLDKQADTIKAITDHLDRHPNDKMSAARIAKLMKN